MRKMRKEIKMEVNKRTVDEANSVLGVYRGGGI